MRRFHIMAVSVLVLAALNSCNTKKSVSTSYDYESIYGKKDDTDEPAGLKLMSFNVRYKTSNDTGDRNWSKRLAAVHEMVNTHKPVLMGVQECLKAQRDDILAGCKDYAVIGVGRDDGKNSGEMMAIFYRKSEVTIQNWGTFWLSLTPDVPSKDWNAACKRSATWAVIRINASGKRLFYVNTHLDHVAGQAEQMAVLERQMEKLNTEHLPMFLTADFNVQQDNPVFDQVQTYMYNARKTAPKTDVVNSYNSWGNTSKASIIDIIFYSKEDVKVLKFKTVFESFSGIRYISDHYPIYGIFSL